MNKKFRVWCKDYNEWEKDYCFLSQDGVLHQMVLAERVRAVRPENHVVQFYTGLNDKNGTEIYEGDIVKYHFTEPMAKNPMTFETFQVIWDEFYKCWSTADKDGQSLNHTGWKFYHLNACGEVIGNIFENKKLLQ